MTQVVKRDGRTVDFNPSYIQNAVKAAFKAVGTSITDDIWNTIKSISTKVENISDVLKVEDIQDFIEKELFKLGFFEEVKAFITYRKKRSDIREGRTELMGTIGSFFTEKETEGSTHKENANVNAYTVSGAFYRIGSEASKDFYKHHMIPEEFAKAHEEGRMHTHKRIVA